MYRVYTGIATGVDVLNAIIAFAGELGWTIDRNQTLNSTAKIVTFSRAGTPYYTLQNNLSGTVHYFVGNMHNGINLSANWNAQPDQYYTTGSPGEARLVVNFTVMPAVSIMAFGANSPTPHMYFAIEMAPGHYRHCMFGNFVNFDPDEAAASFMTGVEVTTSTNQVGDSANVAYPFTWLNNSAFRPGSNGGMRAEGASLTYTWFRFAGLQSTARNPAGFWGDDFVESIYNINTFDQTTELFPPVIQKYQSGVLHDQGYPPNLAFLNMTNYQPKDEITIGPDTWKIFPIVRKLSPDEGSKSGPENERTLNHAIAYLKT